jgi:hypothetical protein
VGRRRLAKANDSEHARLQGRRGEVDLGCVPQLFRRIDGGGGRIPPKFPTGFAAIRSSFDLRDREKMTEGDAARPIFSIAGEWGANVRTPQNYDGCRIGVS